MGGEAGKRKTNYFALRPVDVSTSFRLSLKSAILLVIPLHAGGGDAGNTLIDSGWASLVPEGFPLMPPKEGGGPNFFYPLAPPTCRRASDRV